MQILPCAGPGPLDKPLITYNFSFASSTKITSIICLHVMFSFLSLSFVPKSQLHRDREVIEPQLSVE